MKKIISILSIISLLIIFSCSKLDENIPQTNNVSSLKEVKVFAGKSKFNKSTSRLIENSAELVFDYNQEEISISTALTNDGNYIFDMDNDGLVDLQVQPIYNDYSQIYYLDEMGNKISRAQVDVQGTTAYITILEVYTNSTEKYGQLARKGKWRACFEGVAGSAEGIAGAVICNFGGPWCLAGYYSGIALGCLGA